MTLNDIISALGGAGIEEAEHEALLLAETFSGSDRDSLRIEKNADISSPELEAALSRRITREPLQHILGKWYFWREEYKVSRDCLIPRADSETIVDYAVKNLPVGAHFLDLCTGSGCLAISTLASRPDTTCVAVDISDAALSLARQNAEHNGVCDRIEFILADLLTVDSLGDMKFDAIISNPPYIPTKVVDTLSPELSFEPRIALDGGDDGLIFYRKIIADYKKHLKDGGSFIFEIGYDQGDALISLGGKGTKVCKDLSGNDRMVIIKI